MKNTKKIKFQFNGMTFELPSNAVQTDTYNNNEQFIYRGSSFSQNLYIKVVPFNEKTCRSNLDVRDNIIIRVADYHGFCVGEIDFKRPYSLLVRSSG